MSVLFIAAFIYGIGYGSMQSSLQTWMIQVVSPTQRGMANDVFELAGLLGLLLVPFFVDAIAAMTSYTDMYRYSVMFMILFLLIYLIQGENEAAASPLNLHASCSLYYIPATEPPQDRTRIQNLQLRNTPN